MSYTQDIRPNVYVSPKIKNRMMKESKFSSKDLPCREKMLPRNKKETSTAAITKEKPFVTPRYNLNIRALQMYNNHVNKTHLSRHDLLLQRSSKMRVDAQ